MQMRFYPSEGVKWAEGDIPWMLFRSKIISHRVLYRLIDNKPSYALLKGSQTKPRKVTYDYRAWVLAFFGISWVCVDTMGDQWCPRGLKAPIALVQNGEWWQRCRVYFIRNLSAFCRASIVVVRSIFCEVQCEGGSHTIAGSLQSDGYSLAKDSWAVGRCWWSYKPLTETLTGWKTKAKVSQHILHEIFSIIQKTWNIWSMVWFERVSNVGNCWWATKIVALSCNSVCTALYWGWNMGSKSFDREISLE